MTWTLFLDDERDFAETYTDYNSNQIVLVARSTKEAIHVVEKYGCPNVLYLDHDLGGDDTSMQFLRWFSEFVGDDPGAQHIVKNLDYRIHSANPIGVANIQSFMESWKKSLE